MAVLYHFRYLKILILDKQPKIQELLLNVLTLFSHTFLSWRWVWKWVALDLGSISQVSGAGSIGHCDCKFTVSVSCAGGIEGGWVGGGVRGSHGSCFSLRCASYECLSRIFFLHIYLSAVQPSLVPFLICCISYAHCLQPFPWWYSFTSLHKHRLFLMYICE